MSLTFLELYYLFPGTFPLTYFLIFIILYILCPHVSICDLHFIFVSLKSIIFPQFFVISQGKYYIFIDFFHLRTRKTARQAGRQACKLTKLPSLVHPPNACNSWDWTRPKLRGWNSKCVSTQVTGIHVLELSSAASRGVHHQEVGIRSKTGAQIQSPQYGI